MAQWLSSHWWFSARSLRPQPWLMSHQGKEPLKIYTFTCSFKTYSYMYLLYRHRRNTRIFPVTKIWYRVKMQFLSFTCEDIMVVMATSVSANNKRASQHLAIGVCMINRILHARLRIQILSSSIQLDISLRSLVIYWVEHLKIKFVSTRRHVTSSISYVCLTLNYRLISYIFLVLLTLVLASEPPS